VEANLGAEIKLEKIRQKLRTVSDACQGSRLKMSAPASMQKLFAKVRQLFLCVTFYSAPHTVREEKTLEFVRFIKGN
jgi:hypothetical protein